MSDPQWSAVDAYLAERLGLGDPVLEAALKANAAAGLPGIDVSPAQGKFLHVLAKAIGAKRILEIGTLGGYSAIWLARALPADGRLVTLEYSARHAEVARANIERAGLAAKVRVRVGPALETLPKLAAEAAGAFDFVFIDADKPNNAAYLDWAVKLARPGALVICDNVVRGGAVAVAKGADANALGSRALFDAVEADPRLTASALQTVGAKGWDGFMIAVVN